MNKRLVLIGVLLAVGAALMFWSTTPSRKPRSEDRAVANTEPLHEPRGIEAVPPPTAQPAEPAQPAVPAEPELLPLDCDAPSGDIVTIDRDAISAADFCGRFKQLAGPRTGGDASVMERQGRALLDRMIDLHLARRALSQAGKSVSAQEVDAELERTYQGFKSQKAFEDELERQGVELRTVRTELEERVALRKLIELRSDLAPSAAEIEAAYNEDPTRFGTPRSATVEGFIARAAPSAPAHERARAKSNAEAFFAALQGGASDLDALATQHGLTKVTAFEIDAAGPEPELAAAVLARPAGHWTSVLPSNAGFTVLKVVKVQEGQARPLSEVRDRVIAMLKSQRELGEQKRILAELRAQAVIVQKQW